MLLMLIVKFEFRRWKEDANNVESKTQMGEGTYKGRGYQGTDWIHVDQLGAFLNTAMHLRLLAGRSSASQE
jgi:hypothetical protein